MLWHSGKNKRKYTKIKAPDDNILKHSIFVLLYYNILFCCCCCCFPKSTWGQNWYALYFTQISCLQDFCINTTFQSLGQFYFTIFNQHCGCQMTYRKKLKISKLDCMGIRKCDILQSFDFISSSWGWLASI